MISESVSQHLFLFSAISSEELCMSLLGGEIVDISIEAVLDRQAPSKSSIIQV